MRLAVHPEALDEIESAVDWYNEQRRGLGRELASEIESRFRAIADVPEFFRSDPDVPDVRRTTLRRFPYAIVFAVESDGVVVLAVAHHKRRPGYWRHRVESH